MSFVEKFRILRSICAFRFHFVTSKMCTSAGCNWYFRIYFYTFQRISSARNIFMLVSPIFSMRVSLKLDWQIFMHLRTPCAILLQHISYTFINFEKKNLRNLNIKEKKFKYINLLRLSHRRTNFSWKICVLAMFKKRKKMMEFFFCIFHFS